MAYEKGGIFIVSHLLWRLVSVFAFSFDEPRLLRQERGTEVLVQPESPCTEHYKLTRIEKNIKFTAKHFNEAQKHKTLNWFKKNRWYNAGW